MRHPTPHHPIVSRRSAVAAVALSAAILVGGAGSVRAAPVQADRRASVSGRGVQADADSDFPQISADGRYVIFFSYASNLVAADTNGAADVFVYRNVRPLTPVPSPPRGTAGG